MLKTFSIKQTYPRAQMPYELSMFKLLFTVVISEQFYFQQKNVLSRFALTNFVQFKL